MLFPKLEKPLTALGLTYVACDIHEEYKEEDDLNDKILRRIFLVDLIVWHMLASFVIPAYIISKSVKFLSTRLEKYGFKIRTIKYMAVLVTIPLIYLICGPIDHLVHYAMNESFRRLTNHQCRHLEHTHNTLI